MPSRTEPLRAQIEGTLARHSEIFTTDENLEIGQIVELEHDAQVARGLVVRIATLEEWMAVHPANQIGFGYYYQIRFD